MRGLDVIVTQDTSAWPLRRDLRDARDRAAAALQAAGANVREVSLKPLRRVLDPYVTALQQGAGVTFGSSLGEGVTLRRAAAGAFRGRGPHTIPSVLLLASERASVLLPASATRASVKLGERLAAQVEETMGNGVLLHPPFGRVAPRHGRTVGKPWSIHHAAIFNFLGLPVAQVPLGLNADGLPLGVQVAAAARPRPRRRGGRAGARARTWRVGSRRAGERSRDRMRTGADPHGLHGQHLPLPDRGGGDGPAA